MIDENLPEVIHAFLLETQQEMEAAGVDVQLHNTSHVQGCNGFFEAEDNKQPILAVGCAKSISQWFPTYIHEYCHFKQWKEKSPMWVDYLIEGEESETHMDRWIKGKNYSKKFVKDFMRLSRNVEADCEFRAWTLIKERNLILDPDLYAQTANAYIHFYNYIMLNRKWYIPGKEPYHIYEVYSQMPTEVSENLDDYEEISWEIMDLYDKHCF